MTTGILRACAMAGLLLVAACTETLVGGDGDRIGERVLAMARDGDPTAQTALGVIYERGFGVPQNYERARSWYARAARQGDPLAEFHLGSLYERGLGVSQDHEEAAHWYRRASEKENDAAQAALAYLYEHGLGVDRDYDRARALYAAAARRWHAEGIFPPEAAFALGRPRPPTRLTRRSPRAQEEQSAAAARWGGPPPVEVDLAAIRDTLPYPSPAGFDDAHRPVLEAPERSESVEIPPVLPDPPEPGAARAAGRVSYTVALGRHASAAAAMQAWERLRDGHPALLGTLSATMKREERATGAPLFVIEAGPLPGPDAARILCTALAAQGRFCRAGGA